MTNAADDLFGAVESQLLNEWGPEITLTREQAEQLLEAARSGQRGVTNLTVQALAAALHGFLTNPEWPHSDDRPRTEPHSCWPCWNGADHVLTVLGGGEKRPECPTCDDEWAAHVAGLHAEPEL